MTDWLLGTLVATSGLALLVLLVREPVRMRFGSRVAYGLWLIPAARLFMPTISHTVERRIPAGTPFQPLTDPLVRDSLWMARVAPADPSLIDRIGGWPNVLIALWLAVAASLFVSRLLAYRRDRRAILESSVDVARVGSVRIVRSPEVPSPIALGIFDRLIAVPADFDRLYGARERRLVLEHELAHHRSGDLVANLFAFVLLCLQWFNPLAWVAHAAFRFDQEAACDARVLDKGAAGDRADYGRAIAKAASGRALLFASALDRRNTLQRRLKSMLRSSTSNRRFAGRVLIVGAVAAALPLTASRAVEYVDLAVPAPAPRGTPSVVRAAPPTAVSVAAAAVQPAAEPRLVVAAGPAAGPREIHGDLSINGDVITINGKTKRWENLTPTEKAQVRAAVAKARTALKTVHIDRDKIMREVASIPQKADMERIRSDLARGQGNAAEALRRLEANRAAMEAAGEQPDAIEATVATALQSVQAVDLRTVERSLATIDQRKIAKSVDNAEQAMRNAQAELDRLDARMRQDPQ